MDLAGRDIIKPNPLGTVAFLYYRSSTSIYVSKTTLTAQARNCLV